MPSKPGQEDDHDHHLRGEGRQDDAHLAPLFLSPAMKDEYVGMGIEAGTNSGLDQLTDVVAALKAAA